MRVTEPTFPKTVINIICYYLLCMLYIHRNYSGFAATLIKNKCPAININLQHAGLQLNRKSVETYTGSVDGLIVHQNSW